MSSLNFSSVNKLSVEAFDITGQSLPKSPSQIYVFLMKRLDIDDIKYQIQIAKENSEVLSKYENVPDDKHIWVELYDMDNAINFKTHYLPYTGNTPNVTWASVFHDILEAIDEDNNNSSISMLNVKYLRGQ